MVRSSPQQFIEEKERGRRRGWRSGEQILGDEGHGEMHVGVRGMKSFGSASIHISPTQLLSRYSGGVVICSGVFSAAERDAHVSVG